MTKQILRWATPPAALALAALGALALLPVGCQPPPPNNKVKVAYLGLTCEAPIFAAKEKGFFDEEGLDAELVKTDWDGLREGLGTGAFDANHTLVMYLLKPIEAGLDVQITGGIHTGCLRVQAGTKTDITKVEQLAGKNIGIPTHIGSPPFLFASRVLKAHGIDPDPEKDQVHWKAFPPGDLEKALDDGKVDAVATSDPIGTILIGKKVVRTLPEGDQAIDAPYKDEYCCAAVVSGQLADKDPQKAAKVTRALLKAAKWVQENPKAAAELSVNNSYIASKVDVNTQALSHLNYRPGVAACKKSVSQASEEMQKAGLLKASTDPAALAKRAWMDLPGVTDEWLDGVKVEKVASGGRPKVLSPEGFAALFEGRKACCGGCCCVDD